MKIFFLAGEASGDAHAGALAREILVRRPDVTMLGMGGEQMAAAGVEIVKSIDDMQVMGFAEVVAKVGHFKRVFRAVEARLRREKPDALVLVDYPGFNLRFARQVREAVPKILYYISPQVWAWHRSRVKTMRRLIDRMIVLFEFERPFYEQAGVPVRFAGHPLVDRVAAAPDRARAREALGADDESPLIALLPGSRDQEISRQLPRFLRAAAGLAAAENGPPVRFVIAAASDRSERIAEVSRRAGGDPIPVVHDRTYEVVRAADLAWVCSGTATLETALLGTPLVCCYRAGAVSYALASLIIDFPCISLVNIVAGKPVIPELVQYRFTPRRLERLTRALLNDPQGLERMRAAFVQLAARLGGPDASARAADAVLEVLEEPQRA